MKLALLFPGQGAQYPGMGQELVAGSPAARAVMAEADEALGFSLSTTIFKGTEEELATTDITQPALLAVSIATWAVLREKGLRPDFTAGLSLGEYSALVAAGSVGLPEALQLVRERGRLMQRCVPPGRGGMLAVLGLATEVVEEICRAVAPVGIAEPANYNCPGQVVVAGEVQALSEVASLALRRGAAKAVPLKVSAPFHCSLQDPAAASLRPLLDKISWRDPEPPVVANVSAKPITRAAEIPAVLEAQVNHPVRWEESIRWLIAQGVEAFIEVGPGRSLSGFVKRIAKPRLLANVEDLRSLSKALDLWGEVC